jgi:hypothetical protein
VIERKNTCSLTTAHRHYHHHHSYHTSPSSLMHGVFHRIPRTVTHHALIHSSWRQKRRDRDPRGRSRERNAGRTDQSKRQRRGHSQERQETPDDSEGTKRRRTGGERKERRHRDKSDADEPQQLASLGLASTPMMPLGDALELEERLEAEAQLAAAEDTEVEILDMTILPDIDRPL